MSRILVALAVLALAGCSSAGRLVRESGDNAWPVAFTIVGVAFAVATFVNGWPSIGGVHHHHYDGDEEDDE